MQFHIDLIALVSIIPVWMIIAFAAVNIYRKKQEHMAIWKVILLILVGLFTVDFNWQSSGQNQWTLPILPLGVWIIYFLLRNDPERWQRVRPFAWLGYAASFLFLLSNLISLVLQPIIYPLDEIDTYIADVENADIITTYGNLSNKTIDKEQFMDALETAEVKDLDINNFSQLDQGHTEQFPYILDGINPKWGSGIIPVIYLEKDGKGMLVSSPEKQYYFTTEKRLWE
ncbi:hypothetical protein [Gracilibacillus massiliensis]|uniref:hypothetical protein n=1 Tax=Gracilibacillus massiliensis TaxID=1564956 RepID=UPI00071E2FDA|nr:hypothetical protein [Gracilibacillus massiliensis]